MTSEEGDTLVLSSDSHTLKLGFAGEDKPYVVKRSESRIF
jgi:actin-related protein